MAFHYGTANGANIMWKEWKAKLSPKDAEKRCRHTTSKDPALRAIFDDPTNLVIAFIQSRPRARLFAVQLEYWHFPPHTKLNAAYQFAMLTWLEMPWCVVSVPMGARPIVEQVAGDNGLRLADGFPLCFDGTGPPKRFPFCGDNVYTLESADHAGPEFHIFGQPGDDLEETLLMETIIATWQETYRK